MLLAQEGNMKNYSNNRVGIGKYVPHSGHREFVPPGLETTASVSLSGRNGLGLFPSPDKLDATSLAKYFLLAGAVIAVAAAPVLAADIHDDQMPGIYKDLGFSDKPYKLFGAVEMGNPDGKIEKSGWKFPWWVQDQGYNPKLDLNNDGKIDLPQEIKDWIGWPKTPYKITLFSGNETEYLRTISENASRFMPTPISVYLNDSVPIGIEKEHALQQFYKKADGLGAKVVVGYKESYNDKTGIFSIEGQALGPRPYEKSKKKIPPGGLSCSEMDPNNDVIIYNGDKEAYLKWAGKTPGEYAASALDGKVYSEDSLQSSIIELKKKAMRRICKDANSAHADVVVNLKSEVEKVSFDYLEKKFDCPRNFKYSNGQCEYNPYTDGPCPRELTSNYNGECLVKKTPVHHEGTGVWVNASGVALIPKDKVYSLK